MNHSFRFLCLLLSLLAAGLAPPALAQRPTPPDSLAEEPFEVLLQRRANRHTSILKGYGTILLEFSPPVGSGGVRPFLSRGVELGVIVQRRWRLGAYSLYTTAPQQLLKNSPFAPAQDPVAAYLQLGGTVAWLPRAERPVHVVLGARLGYGGTVLSYFDPLGQPENLTVLTSPGLLLTPFADVELNLRPWLRASLGAGYRLATGDDTPYFRPRRDFSGPVLQAGFHFGNFK